MNDKKKTAKSAWLGILILLLGGVFGCGRQPLVVPEGGWRSEGERPDILILKEDSAYVAVVFHRIYGGGVCPVKYPLVCTPTTMYIQAEGRIRVFYDREKDGLFLSPGGAYRRLGIEAANSDTVPAASGLKYNFNKEKYGNSKCE